MSHPAHTPTGHRCGRIRLSRVGPACPDGAAVRENFKGLYILSITIDWETPTEPSYFSRSSAVTNRGSISTGTDVSLSSTAFVGGRITPSVSIICLALA